MVYVAEASHWNGQHQHSFFFVGGGGGGGRGAVNLTLLHSERPKL